MLSISGWLAARKSYLSPLLFLSGALVLLLAWLCNPIPVSAISNITLHADYVGPLQAEIGRRGVGGGVVGLGYGIGTGSTYARFSKVLNLGEKDLEEIRAAGTPYQVGIYDRSIVTISGARRYVITYDDYVARATRLRNLFLITGFAILMLASGILIARGTDPQPK
jgi:hypothetical protein